MNTLFNYFTDKVEFAFILPLRLIFQERPEKQSPAPEASKEAKELPRDLFLQVQDLNKQINEITRKEIARMERGQKRPLLSKDEEIQRSLLDRELRAIGEQLNKDYNLGIDFSKIDYFRLFDEKNGFHLIASKHEGTNEKTFAMQIALRADGTYDKRMSGVGGDKDTYYDSRTGITRSYDWNNMSDRRGQIKDGLYYEPSFE